VDDAIGGIVVAMGDQRIVGIDLAIRDADRNGFPFSSNEPLACLKQIRRKFHI